MDISTVTNVIETLTAFSIHWTTSYVRYVDATEEILSQKLNAFILKVRSARG